MLRPTRVLFDSVRLFPEDSLESAVNFGKANSQKAIYRLSSGEEILLEEDPVRTGSTSTPK